MENIISVNNLPVFYFEITKNIPSFAKRLSIISITSTIITYLHNTFSCKTTWENKRILMMKPLKNLYDTSRAMS